MKMNLVNILIASIIIVMVSIFIYSKAQTMNDFQKKSFEEKRNKILSELDLTLKEATESGKYKCCIDPPCKMCFLGNWIWNDGSCDCDTLILQEKWDYVCPECKRGIREGRCTSSIEGTCSGYNEGE